MATLRNKRKLAAVSRETPENTRKSHSRNTLAPGMTQEYICKVSEEIEGKVTEKLSNEFNWTESRVLDALSKLDELLLNPQVWTCSVIVPEHPGITNQKTGSPLGIVPHAIIVL